MSRMPAPTGSDGLQRAVEEFLIPSAGILILVVLVKELLGPVLAGLVYLLLTGAVFLGLYVAAKYWNLRYLPVFVVTGFGLIWMAPTSVGHQNIVGARC